MTNPERQACIPVMQAIAGGEAALLLGMETTLDLSAATIEICSGGQGAVVKHSDDETMQRRKTASGPVEVRESKLDSVNWSPRFTFGYEW